MSLDKAIKHGKEHRRPYRGSEHFDRSCRPHGSCPWCRNGRSHASRRLSALADVQDTESPARRA